MIEEFPEDDNAEDTNYLAQYALVLKAIADGVENAKDPSPLLQNFVDEEFGQFDDLYDKASELTSTILEYLEDREELIDWGIGKTTLALTDDDQRVIAQQAVVLEFHHLINALHSRINES